MNPVIADIGAFICWILPGLLFSFLLGAALIALGSAINGIERLRRRRKASRNHLPHYIQPIRREKP